MQVKKFNFHYFPRDFEGGDFIENFLVSAVSSVLLIRLFLLITHYPKILTHEFYIEHMLFGGFIMMLTLIGLLVFLNRETKIIASVTGGIGFGAFIDELGKFITRDNNYFYQYTFAIIYVIFVLIFLVARIIEKYFRLTESEYAINALEVAKNAIMHDLDTEEKERALYLLKYTAKDDNMSRMLEKALRETRAISPGPPSIFHKVKNFLQKLYINLIHQKYFNKLVVGFFIISALINFFGAIYGFGNIENFAGWGQFIFSVLSGFLVLLGTQFLLLKSSRKIAYQMFRYSLLISIFLTQYFRFLQEQLSAIFGLILSLIVLSVVQYLSYEESVISKE